MLGACAPAYIPNTVNTPLFSNKGEFQISVYKGLAGTDPQFACAITDNIGLMLNGSFANRTNDTTNNYHKHQFLELGIGYYSGIGEKGRFEVYTGYGFGKLSANYESGIFSDRANVNTSRIFLQPAIGVSSDVYDGSFATRFVAVNLTGETENSLGFFVEPVFTSKIGYRYVKGVIQFGMSFPFEEDQIEFNYQPFIFSIGVQANIGRIYDE